MQWKQPPVIKIYEALGAIADERLKHEDGENRVYSSSGNKYYLVEYNENENAIMCNDNGSYWQGYLGYPAVAFLMQKGLIKFNQRYSQALKGIAWKDINQQNKNDFSKTIEYCNRIICDKKLDLDHFLSEIDQIAQQISDLKLNKLGPRRKPPTAY